MHDLEKEIFCMHTFFAEIYILTRYPSDEQEPPAVRVAVLVWARQTQSQMGDFCVTGRYTQKRVNWLWPAHDHRGQHAAEPGSKRQAMDDAFGARERLERQKRESINKKLCASIVYTVHYGPLLRNSGHFSRQPLYR